MRAVGRHRDSGIDAARRAQFEAIFSEVYEPLQRYVRRRTSASDVDDVVADALVVAWRRLDDVPPEAPVAWMYGVARNCLANHQRTVRRAERLTLRVVDATRTGTSPGVPIDDPLLDAALAQLNDGDRELLRLWAWEQLSPAEISVVLDVTPNAASIRLHRAKQRLAALMAAERKTAIADGHTSDEHREEGER